MKIRGEIYALVIAASVGVAGYGIRAAANRPHPLWTGIATGAIAFTICIVIIAFARAMA